MIFFYNFLSLLFFNFSNNFFISYYEVKYVLEFFSTYKSNFEGVVNYNLKVGIKVL